MLLHDSTLQRLWGHDVRLDRLDHRELAERTGGGVPALHQALSAAGDRRVMLDLPGATDTSVRETVGVVRECGAQDRVYYCADTHAMLKVRAADPSAEIALTWTTLAPPRAVLLDAVRPRWLNYRFGLLSRELADRVHADGLLVSAWTVDTRRTMRPSCWPAAWTRSPATASTRSGHSWPTPPLLGLLDRSGIMGGPCRP